jgi:flagellar hook assembly protein FlgD
MRFVLAQPGIASVTVFDILGRLVYRWEKRNAAAWVHTVHWEGTDTEGKSVGAGLYLYRIEVRKFQYGSPVFVSTKKMVMIG